eukprot:8701055-Lingulodinium_polyedra.AAC.1
MGALRRRLRPRPVGNDDIRRGGPAGVADRALSAVIRWAVWDCGRRKAAIRMGEASNPGPIASPSRL